MKKTLALLLALLMLVTVLPTAAFARPTPETYVCKIGETEYASVAAALKAEHPNETAENPTVITMIDDSTEAKLSIGSTRHITLDLNGCVLNGAQKGSVIINEGKLTIKDSNPEFVHYFEYEPEAAWVWLQDPTEPQINAAVTVAELTKDATVVKLCGGCITGGICCGKSGNYFGGGILNIDTNAEILMNGGSIVGNTAHYGGGVANLRGSSFTLNKGSITGNSSVSEAAYAGGGGVYNNGSCLEMNGGEISHNTATFAGCGVCNLKSSSFKMTDGAITGNTQAMSFQNEYECEGGGVFNYSSRFEMTGGSITWNEAALGAGVSNFKRFSDTAPTDLIIIDGTITNNYATKNAAGVHNTADCNMTVGGTTVIRDNTAPYYWGDLKIHDTNLILVETPISVDKDHPLTVKDAIGVTSQTDVPFTTENDGDLTDYFTSDFDCDYVKNGENNALELASRIIQQPTPENGYEVGVYMERLDYDESELIYRWNSDQEMPITADLLTGYQQYDASLSYDNTFYPVDVSNGAGESYVFNLILSTSFQFTGFSFTYDGSFTWDAPTSMGFTLDEDGVYRKSFEPTTYAQLTLPACFPKPSEGENVTPVENVTIYYLGAIEGENEKALKNPSFDKEYIVDVIFKDYLISSDPVKAAYCAELYNKDDSLDEEYVTVAEAFDELESGQTLKLLRDYTGSNNFIIPTVDAEGNPFSFTLNKDGNRFKGEITTDKGYKLAVNTDNDNGTLTYTVEKEPDPDEPTNTLKAFLAKIFTFYSTLILFLGKLGWAVCT